VDFDEMRNAYNRASVPDRLRRHSENCVESELLIVAANRIEQLERSLTDLEAEIRRLERIACA
jgi:hypothetical protein